MQPAILVISSLFVIMIACHKLMTDFELERVSRAATQFRLSKDEARAELAELRAELREQLGLLRERSEERIERRYQELVIKLIEIENRLSKLARAQRS